MTKFSFPHLAGLAPDEAARTAAIQASWDASIRRVFGRLAADPPEVSTRGDKIQASWDASIRRVFGELREPAGAK